MPSDLNNKKPDKLIGKAIKLTDKPIKLFEKISLIPKLGKEDALRKHLKNVGQQ